MEVNNDENNFNGGVEIEEGEAGCYDNEEDDCVENVDLDTRFAYIGEKLDQLLGHVQKNFEGGASAENLGALCGGYGSFLPTYERPLSVLSTPKTPLGNCNRSKSPRSSMEGACQNLKALSKALPTLRHGNSLPQARLSQNSRDVGAVLRTEDSCVPSTQVAERCVLKNETSNKSGNPTDLRSLKVRIKMKSDNTSCKNVAIYSGLGLSSPSSSFGNSSNKSGEIPPASQENAEEPPTNIIKVMTSFPVPGHGFISPLHDSLLCLTRNKKLPEQNMMPQFKGSQERPLLASVRSNGRLSLESNVEVSQAKGKGEKQVDLKTEDIKSVKTGMKFLIQKKSGTDTQGAKEPLFNGHKSIQKSNSGGDVSACAKVTQRTPDPRLTNEKEVKGRSSSKLVKPESLELMSGHGCFNKEKQEKFQKRSVKDSYKDSFVDIRDEGKNLGNKFSASVNLPGTIIKCKEEADLHPQNAGEETTYYDEEKSYGPVKKEKLSFEGKNKPKGKVIHIKQPVNLTKDNLGVEMGRKSKDEMNSGSGVSPSSGKGLKLKSQKDRLQDVRRDSLASKVLELLDVAERPIDDYDVTFKSSKDKPFGKLSGRKADNRLMSGGLFTDASAACRPTIENELDSEFVPVAAAPCVIKEEWVCCDSCQKWRLLPFGKTPDQLPDEWMCSMLDWLGPGMNRCDISEDEMTKAFYASYQPPSTESLTDPLNAAHGTTSGVPLFHAQQLEQNYQNLSSNGMSNRVNKRHGVKEIRNASSGDCVLKPYLQEPVKSRGLKHMNRQHLVPNIMKKSTDQHMSNLQDSGMDEIIVEQKEKQLRGGDTNRVRLKYKKDTDQYICHTTKKPRREDLLHADVDHGTAGLTSGQSQGRKYNDLCYSEDTEDKLRVSVRKLGHKPENSSDGGSLDLKMSRKGDPMKKRRHREWEDDDKVYTKEGSSESDPWREKKARIVKKEGKEPSTSNIDDKSDRKGRITKIVVSGTRAHSVDATKKDNSSVRDQHPMNYSKRNASQQVFKGENVLRMAFGPGYDSLAATSSSSKVSGSRRTRGDIEEVKGGSPVESVSSSPVRTSNSDRVASGKGDAFTNHDRIGQHDEFLNHQHGVLHCHHDIRENKNHQEDAVLLKNTIKDSCLRSKENSRGSVKALDTDKMKIFDPVDEYSKKSQRNVAEIDSNHVFRNSLSEECSTKPVKAKGEKLHATRWDGSSVGAVGIQVKRKGYEVADGKFGATESPNRKSGTQHNLNQDFECGQKQNNFISGKPKSYLNSQNESKEGKEGVESKEWARSSGSQAMPWPERAVLQKRSLSPTVNGSAENSLNQRGAASTKSGVSNNVEHHGARVVNASSPAISASSQIAAKILNEARSLRDKAEQSKNGGFHDVSSVAYFQAAQKFLQGASILESCIFEKGKHEDMTPVQVYSSTAKLCEFCAHEFEKLKEVASAALAYKCMEVAYMRMVVCKHSSVSRDQHDLQATLIMPHQGESPSSSASDIDHLTNQVMTEKTLLPKNIGPHVAGNYHVAGNHPKILRLLDFTQDVNCAMEASKKSQGAFTAACLTLEDALKSDCISSIRRVIEFSFQDVEEFVRLVELAMKAIGQSKFGGAKD